MTIHYGKVDVDSTLYIPFESYNSAGASLTLTGLAVTDIEIYKNGGTTQRSSDAGYTLLDTDGIDFDGITGIHGFSIDLSDNTDAGFFAAAAHYWVIVSSVTISGETVSFIAATFDIGPQNVNVAQVSGDATAADNLELDYDGTGYAKTNSTIGTCTTNTDMAGTDGAALASVCTEARLAELDAANLPADVDAILTDTGTTLPATLATIAGYIDTEVAAILVDTGTTLDAAIAAMAAEVSAILVDTATTLQGELDAIQAAVITNAAGVDIAADIIAMKAETALIVADSNELQTDLTDGGRLDLLIDAIKAVTDLLTAAHTEPTGVPAVNETPLDKLAYLFMMARNKLTVTSGKKTFFGDDGIAEFEQDLTDDGTTYTQTEVNVI